MNRREDSKEGELIRRDTNKTTKGEEVEANSLLRRGKREGKRRQESRRGQNKRDGHRRVSFLVGKNENRGRRKRGGKHLGRGDFEFSRKGAHKKLQRCLEARRKSLFNFVLGHPVKDPVAIIWGWGSSSRVRKRERPGQ